jgi:MFS superfamily sulfate permease-like transporter
MKRRLERIRSEVNEVQWSKVPLHAARFVLFPKGMNLWENLKQNWRSGITTALASYPLSLSFAIASNASPILGMRTGALGAMVAALLGGSQYNVAGPTGALANLVAQV